MRASERAYLQLRDDIIEWRRGPGSVLAEVELSAGLGVSRTPVREALGKLLADGLASAQGGRGLVVSDVSPTDIVQLFELRQALEQRVARLAAAGRTPGVFATLADEFRAAPHLLDGPDRQSYYDVVTRFDTAMDAAAANPYLVGALRAVRPQLARVRRISHDDPARLTVAAREHLAIAEAVESGDADLAAAATHVHLHQSLTSILASADRLSAQPTGATP